MKEETRRLLCAAKAGDTEARERLIVENTGLVWSIVHRFRNRGYEQEDLFQLGVIGLVKAIDHFDLEMNLQLSTYAVHLIQGEIKRFIRDDGAIKVSRTLKENAWKIKKAQNELLQKYGKEPGIEELSKATGIRREDILLALEADREVESIYQSVYPSEGKELTLIDQLADTRRTQEEQVEEKILLKQLLQQLDETGRRLIRMRFYEEKTQTEIAAALGISQVQVSRLEKKLLEKLRKMIRE